MPLANVRPAQALLPFSPFDLGLSLSLSVQLCFPCVHRFCVKLTSILLRSRVQVIFLAIETFREMEKIPNGGLKLPVGFRFHPTDEELLVHYLKRKVLGLPLPASVIPEFDVFHTDPWNLPGDVKEQRYFFSKVGDSLQGENKCKRISYGYGYWKLIGKDKQIVDSESNQAIGMRKALNFYHTKHSNKTKTQWVMYEYRLGRIRATISNTNQIHKTKLENWFVYRIFERKRGPRKLGVISNASNVNMTQRITGPNLVDFRVKQENHFQPSSPCSSIITEISSNGSDQEEISPSIMRKN